MWVRWLVLLLAALPIPEASACSIIGDPEFIPGEPVESEPPGPVEIGEIAIEVRDPPAGCNASDTSCGDGSGVRVVIPVNAIDDTTSRFELGFRVRVVGGPTPPRSPIGFRDRGPVTMIQLSLDSDHDIDFELAVSAIDQSGNVGPETIVRIAATDRDGGCRSARGGSFASFALGLATLALLARRRR